MWVTATGDLRTFSCSTIEDIYRGSKFTPSVNAEHEKRKEMKQGGKASCLLLFQLSSEFLVCGFDVFD
jgi:hypothetical protein